MTTLREAKDKVLQERAKGITCPCCGQLAKMYVRKLNSGMAATLIRMYRFNRLNYSHVKSFLLDHKLKNNHDWTLLKHWGFIEEFPDNDDPAKKSSGVWRITPTGEMFINREIPAPSHIKLYNNELIGFTGSQTTIVAALGRHFNYQELMSIFKINHK